MTFEKIIKNICLISLIYPDESDTSTSTDTNSILRGVGRYKLFFIF